MRSLSLLYSHFSKALRKNQSKGRDYFALLTGNIRHAIIQNRNLMTNYGGSDMSEQKFDRHGLTIEAASRRWNELSGYGRTYLIAEAFADLNLKRHGEQYFGDMANESYQEMCSKLSGYGHKLMGEIHRRLAGGKRINDKTSHYCNSLLSFATTDK